MIVIDASAALEIVIRTAAGARVEARVVREDLHAPHLIDIEVTNALRRLVKTGALNLGVAEEALIGMHDWPLVRHDHTALLNRIWEMRDCVSAYDGCYVALAETLGATLLTFDAKLSRAQGHKAKIELLA